MASATPSITLISAGEWVSWMVLDGGVLGSTAHEGHPVHRALVEFVMYYLHDHEHAYTKGGLLLQSISAAPHTNAELGAEISAELGAFSHLPMAAIGEGEEDDKEEEGEEDDDDEDDGAEVGAAARSGASPAAAAGNAEASQVPPPSMPATVESNFVGGDATGGDATVGDATVGDAASGEVEGGLTASRGLRRWSSEWQPDGYLELTKHIDDLLINYFSKHWDRAQDILQVNSLELLVAGGEAGGAEPLSSGSTSSVSTSSSGSASFGSDGDGGVGGGGGGGVGGGGGGGGGGLSPDDGSGGSDGGGGGSCHCDDGCGGGVHSDECQEHHHAIVRKERSTTRWARAWTLAMRVVVQKKLRT